MKKPTQKISHSASAQIARKTSLSYMPPVAWAYIFTNAHLTTLYTGSTTDLPTRLWEHQTKRNPKSFSARYNVFKPVYFEPCGSIEEARDRERYIKGKTRKWKEALMTKMNPEWKDLTEEINLIRHRAFKYRHPE